MNEAPGIFHVTLNDRPVIAHPGETVLALAKREGVNIPSLCASDNLEPYGSCRLCLCEVEGQKGTPASCTTLVREGMRIRTASEKLTHVRRNIVELYLSEQSANTITPPALQALAAELGLHSVRYLSGNQRLQYDDSSNPFFSFDNSICVSCARCVRACDEIQGTVALAMVNSGFETRPMAGSLGQGETGFEGSTCVSCGACVKECPTGALQEKTISESGEPTDWVRTTCAYCGVGCTMRAGVKKGHVVTMVPADDGPSNQGHACMKGRFGWTYIYAQDRLRVPLLRQGSRWIEITWETALDRIAQEFSRIKTTAGPDAVALHDKLLL